MSNKKQRASYITLPQPEEQISLLILLLQMAANIFLVCAQLNQFFSNKLLPVGQAMD